MRANRSSLAHRPWRHRAAPAPLRNRLISWLYVGLFGVALVLGVLDVAGHGIAGATRSLLTDAATPALEAVSGAILAAKAVVARTLTVADAAREVERLRAENLELRRWRRTARELETRARRYEALLKLQPDPDIAVITARAIAGSPGRFARALIVNAGSDAGLHEGNAVLGPEGLIGRVVALGARSGRVLLVTDLASRIPVHVGSKRHRAILAGTNGDEPTLQYLPAGARVSDGDLVVTSGEGRLLPAGLPVGTVRLAGDQDVRVSLATEPSQAEFVRILDYRVPIDVVDGAPAPPALLVRVGEQQTADGAEVVATAAPPAEIPEVAGAQ